MSSIFTESKSYGGPWLVSKSNLLDLDSTLNEIFNKYQTLIREKVIGTDVLTPEEEQMKIADYIKHSKYYAPESRIVVNLKNKVKERKYKSILDLVKDLDIKSEEIKSIVVYITSLENSFELNISRYLDDKLELTISTESKMVQQDIYFAIEQWIEKIRPNKVITIWHKLNDWLPVYAFAALLIYPFFWMQNNDYDRIYKSEAKELLKMGINDANRDKAIELILKLNANYIPSSYQYDFSSLLWGSLIIIIILLTIFFSPKTTFELGKGKNKFSLYKIWIKISTVVIPSMILLPLIINLLTSIIEKS